MSTVIRRIQLKQETVKYFAAGGLSAQMGTFSGACTPDCTDGCGGSYNTITECTGPCCCSACDCPTGAQSCGGGGETDYETCEYTS